jgi:hypothetical protein
MRECCQQRGPGTGAHARTTIGGELEQAQRLVDVELHSLPSVIAQTCHQPTNHSTVEPVKTGRVRADRAKGRNVVWPRHT